MTDDIAKIINDRGFCQICGHEGNDTICPICNEKMQSLAEETERLAQIENTKSELFDDPQESLEDVQQMEEKEDKEADGKENSNI